jgi:hypothetical protein
MAKFSSRLWHGHFGPEFRQADNWQKNTLTEKRNMPAALATNKQHPEQQISHSLRSEANKPVLYWFWLIDAIPTRRQNNINRGC